MVHDISTSHPHQMCAKCACAMHTSFLFSSKLFITSRMSVEADVEGVLCLSHVLLSALPAFNQVDDIPFFTGGHRCSMYADGGCAPKKRGCLGMCMVADEAVSGATRAASTSWWSLAGLSSHLTKRS